MMAHDLEHFLQIFVSEVKEVFVLLREDTLPSIPALELKIVCNSLKQVVSEKLFGMLVLENIGQLSGGHQRVLCLVVVECVHDLVRKLL